MFTFFVSSIADARHTPQGAIGSDIAGVRNATSGSLTDKLTRDHRMTLDEAHLILNVKQGETLENVLKVNLYCFVDFLTACNIDRHDRIMNIYSK